MSMKLGRSHVCWCIICVTVIHMTRMILDIDECATGHDHCDRNANCSSTIGSFTCKCKDTFYGDGMQCEGTGICMTLLYMT